MKAGDRRHYYPLFEMRLEALSCCDNRLKLTWSSHVLCTEIACLTRGLYQNYFVLEAHAHRIQLLVKKIEGAPRAAPVEVQGW